MNKLKRFISNHYRRLYEKKMKKEIPKFDKINLVPTLVGTPVRSTSMPSKKWFNNVGDFADEILLAHDYDDEVKIEHYSNIKTTLIPVHFDKIWIEEVRGTYAEKIIRIGFARQKIIEYFLQNKGSEILFFLDSDVIIEPLEAKKLISLMVNEDLDILQNKYYMPGDVDNLAQVGLGCTLIRRRAAKVAMPFALIYDSRHWSTEDNTFFILVAWWLHYYPRLLKVRRGVFLKTEHLLLKK